MAIPEASNLPIRYASAGPVIGNAEGGEAVPGQGFQLRMAELADSQGTLTLSSTLTDVPVVNAPTVLQATLANPKPNRRYRATCIVMLESTADLLQGIGGRFSWQVDAGAFAGAGAGFGGKVGAAGVTACAGQFQFESILTLGSALPSPVLNTSTSLTVRAQLQGTADVDLSAGMFAYIALTEHL